MRKINRKRREILYDVEEFYKTRVRPWVIINLLEDPKLVDRFVHIDLKK